MDKPVKADGTVGKALEVLDQVAAYGRPVKFSELLQDSPYPKATLFRFLQTLTNQQMLSLDTDTGAYSLGIRLMRLAHAAWKNASLAPIARPFLEQLATEVGEAVHLAQLDNGQVLFVDKLRATDRFETLAQVGHVAPAYCTGVGKAMLAFLAPKRLQIVLQQQSFYKFTTTTKGSADDLSEELAKIRKSGIAFDHEEHEQGINSIAAPILSTNGRIVGAISIASATTRFDTEALKQFRQPLLKTAKLIGDEATSWQFPS
ncbi:IclR family transcriptional regulator [Amylibacter marinus]|uniref:IclR family transcriptional regulator n=1 Tax=Amylibacter marinus TaxID=1475483 RepID=A0ABQ5VUD0_9RHOB|nr:IclR family transcriptional regulator [Amylibacter marinus]GLQ34833.1 IclR family transcriptional regulator [Amylibacter marinus]